jgi:hypothetical protein
MVELSSYHTILAELHTGMLTLAGLCVLTIALTKAVPGIRKYGPRAAVMLEPTSYVSAVGGTFVLVLSGIVGLLTRSIDILLVYPVAENKVMFAAFALNLWTVAIVIRAKFGSSLWDNRRLATTYTVVAVAGLGFITLVGSLSGHLMMKESPLDPVYELLNIDLNKSILLPENVSYAITLLMIVVIAAGLVSLLRARKRRAKKIQT